MDPLWLIASALALGMIGLILGYAAGQGTARRMVRGHLWVLFHEIDAEPTAGKVRYDLLNLIKRLEL